MLIIHPFFKLHVSSQSLTLISELQSQKDLAVSVSFVHKHNRRLGSDASPLFSL